METDEQLEETKNLKINRARFNIKAIPWFMGFSNDLMFYIAINTIFLTTAKNLTAAQISLCTTIPCLSYIILQRLFLKIIKKLGNAKSVRIGTIMLLLASIIITFAKSYWVIMIGQILYTTSFIFKSMDNVMLKNNLAFLNKKDEYIKYKNKSSIIYSTITTIIALFAGYLFKINYYLPMYLCILICVLNVFVSIKLTDEKEDRTKDIENKDIKEKLKFNKLIFLIMLSYGLFYATIGRGQTNTKLLIQYELGNYFDIGITAIYFSYILVMSRISRILSNIAFYKIYDRVKEKIGYYLPILCGLAFVCVILGKLNSQMELKFILMSIGFCIILGIRDVFSTYMQDLLLKKTKPEEQQSGIAYLGLSRKIGETIISFIISLMLLKVELLYVIVALLVLATISFIINLRLYKMVK